MEKHVHFHDVGKRVKKRNIFNHFSFDFKEGRNVCLIGENGVGKTLLLKIVAGEITHTGDILKEGVCRVLYKSEIISDSSIYEYLSCSELSLDYQGKVKSFLHLKNFHYPIKQLNPKFQLKILLLEQILKRPKFLFVDDILFLFSREEKLELLNLLSDLDITLFYVTSHMEDTLLFPYLIVMGQNGILMEGSTYLLLQEEKLLKRLGFSLPFFAELSLQLKSYGLIDEMYLDKKELTSHLWK